MSRRGPARRLSSSEDERSNVSHSNAPLSPPRPFFIGGSGERGSYSSADSSSVEPASDSDRETGPMMQTVNGPVRSTVTPAAPRYQHHQPQHSASSSHVRRSSGQQRQRQRSSMSYAPVEVNTPLTAAFQDNEDTQGAWSPNTLYADSPTSRPPPSSFAFPFQAHPGNPDPGTHVPGTGRSSRRSSLDSLPRANVAFSDSSHDNHPLSDSGLPPPHAPFMADGSSSPRQRSASGHSIYRGSAAGNLSSSPSAVGLNDLAHDSGSSPNLPRSGSSVFRAPFLAPSSRPASTIWSPPSYAHFGTNPNSPTGSSSALAHAMPGKKPPAPSTRLAGKLSKEDKPWLAKKDGRERAAWWLTLFMIFLGIAGAAILCWRGVAEVFMLKDSDLCQILSEEFSGSSLDESVWSRDNQLGGFGNNEFEMTTDSSDNLFIRNGELYFYPTLTSDKLDGGKDAIFDGGEWDLGDACTTSNTSACTVKSSTGGSVVNPVMSARINTKGKKSITYGKVEVKAKLPRGDWLWPAIWMLPEEPEGTDSDNTDRGLGQYGKWPMSGEIDIMEARGNDQNYAGQGINYVRSSLNYGPLESVLKTLYGWWSLKQSTYADDFHTFTMEWAPGFIRIYADSRLMAMMEKRTRKEKEGWWHRGEFPQTAQNGSTQAVVTNIWEEAGRDYHAPFDQPFYLIINLSAGGTSGWFPDKVGNKPWYDGSASAISDFAKAQDTWYSTWPQSDSDRSFRIKSVKMWKYGSC